MLLFTVCAAAFAGGIALLISNGERVSEGARLASVNAAPPSATPASGWNDLDFLLCHTPTKAAKRHDEKRDPLGCGADRGAAGENERRVARAGVCGYRSAGVGRPRLALVQSHDFEPRGAGLFRPRTAADLCVQSRGGATRIP